MLPELMQGIALGSAASMLVTAGIWLGVLRARVRSLSNVLQLIVETQTEGTKILVDVARVLKSLDHKHTPEYADGAGFGTEWLRQPVADFTRRQEAAFDFLRELRAELKSNHDATIRHLDRLEGGTTE